MKKISKAEPSFLVKLYQILKEKEYASLIRWGSDGHSIIISDMNRLTKRVLSKYYNHHNFDSFVRQLNIYNFLKVCSENKNGKQKYFHSELITSKTIKEIQLIKRKKELKKNL